MIRDVFFWLKPLPLPKSDFGESMRLYLSILFLIVSIFCQAQNVKKDENGEPEKERRLLTEKAKQNPKAAHDQYRIITLERDTTYVDTSLTIQSEYKFNYLKKDNLGVDAVCQRRADLQYVEFRADEVFGLSRIRLQSQTFQLSRSRRCKLLLVATLLTELYFKTVMEQGRR